MLAARRSVAEEGGIKLLDSVEEHLHQFRVEFLIGHGQAVVTCCTEDKVGVGIDRHNSEVKQMRGNQCETKTVGDL